MTIAIREADAGDRTFVIDNWLSTFRTSYAAGLIQMDDWFDVMWPQIEKLLARPGVRTLVAYDPEESDRIVDLAGFIAFDPEVFEPVSGLRQPMVLYIYVKAQYRKWGYARKLFAAAGIDPREPFFFACRTEAAQRLAHKIPRAKWQPLPARFPKTDTAANTERRPRR